MWLRVGREAGDLGKYSWFRINPLVTVLLREGLARSASRKKQFITQLDATHMFQQVAPAEVGHIVENKLALPVVPLISRLAIFIEVYAHSNTNASIRQSSRHAASA